MLMGIIKRKSGMELQVNFIVMLVLAIAVFVVGLFVLAMIIDKLKPIYPPPKPTPPPP